MATTFDRGYEVAIKLGTRNVQTKQYNFVENNMCLSYLSLSNILAILAIFDEIHNSQVFHRNVLLTTLPRVPEFH